MSSCSALLFYAYASSIPFVMTKDVAVVQYGNHDLANRVTIRVKCQTDNPKVEFDYVAELRPGEWIAFKPFKSEARCQAYNYKSANFELHLCGD